MKPNYNHNDAPLALRCEIPMTNYNTYRHPSTICPHCNGSLILKYDDLYCIQCSRIPNQTHPTMITDKEYKLRERGEQSVQNRIDRAAQGYR